MNKIENNKYENSWQGSQAGNQTFEVELEAVDAAEIREVLGDYE